jgi:hypothetical protein
MRRPHHPARAQGRQQTAPMSEAHVTGMCQQHLMVHVTQGGSQPAGCFPHTGGTHLSRCLLGVATRPLLLRAAMYICWCWQWLPPPA